MNGLSRDEIQREIAALDQSPERERIAAASIALAESGDAEAINALRERLRRHEFLARLDDLDDPQASLNNLQRVFAALERHPGRATAELGIDVAGAPDFNNEPARLNYLLPALAAVRPMSEAAADLFRRTNHEGFYGVNAPLVAENGSPLALAVFSEMIASPEKDAPNKIYVLHHSVVPRRTQLPLLQTCAALIEQGLEPAVETGIIESIFDYQERPWYGNIRHPPRPPSWQSATSETLRFVLDLAARVKTRPALPPQLIAAIDATVATITAILAERPV